MKLSVILYLQMYLNRLILGTNEGYKIKSSFLFQYTKPVDDDISKPAPTNGDKTKRKQLSDDEIFAKLRLIVSHGDPIKKYKSKDKIGQG